jgi:hypothetical protein
MLYLILGDQVFMLLKPCLILQEQKLLHRIEGREMIKMKPEKTMDI